MHKIIVIPVTILSLILIMLSGTVLAQRRPDSRNMTCDQAKDLVRSNGAVVMTTGRHTFERVVASRRWCQMDEITERYYVPTRDQKRCRVGNKCVPGNIDFR